jgi:transcriptional regulator with XRE-family HTH domain
MRRGWGEREPVIGGTVECNETRRDGRAAFGRMLAEALRGRRMKQEDLARALGTTQSSVSGWINGKYEPAAATVFTIEHSLGLSPGCLSRPLGYLPVEPAAPVSVEAAIVQSPHLDDDAKDALAALYRVLTKRTTPVVVPPRQRRPAPTTKRRGPAAADRPRSVAAGH